MDDSVTWKEDGETVEAQKPDRDPKQVYVQFDVEDVPPWYMVIILAIQPYMAASMLALLCGSAPAFSLYADIIKHYLVMFVSTFTTPLFFAGAMCLDLNNPDINDIVNTLFFISGIATLVQSSIGVRLGIIQGSSFAFLPPIFAILSQPKWKCPATDLATDWNLTTSLNVSTTENPLSVDDIWKPRMREISGTIMVASAFQILIGLTGILEGMLRFIGPLTIAPTITIIGVSLFQVAADMCSEQWGISMLTVLLITVTSQLMRNVTVPYTTCSSRCCKKAKGVDEKPKKMRFPLFSMFSFILSMLFVWLLCYILTVTNAFGKNPGEMGYLARTDLRVKSLRDTKWFRVPYPFQFGFPTVSIAGILGMLAATFASVVESVGDYYACARVSGAPPPPRHAINRGIFMEGVFCMLSGMFGAGIGSTSYSQNIGIISITKVGSRRIIQVCGAITIILALLGKFAALFVTIPTPVVGGIFMVMFGMIAAVGISNLHFVDLRSSRNLYILGISILLGLSIPAFLGRNENYIQSGYTILDQVCTVLLSTGMFVAGAIALILDNIVPGTREERGLVYWEDKSAMTSDDVTATVKTYDIPFIGKILDRCACTSYIPVCHNFKGCRCGKSKSRDITE